MKAWRFIDCGAMGAGGAVAGLSAAAWVAARWSAGGWGGGAAGGRIPGGMLVAWLMLVWLVATAGAVIWVAGVGGMGGAAGQGGRRSAWRAWEGWFWVSTGVGLVLVAVALDSGRLGVMDALKVYVLVAAWLAFWTGLGDHLRRWGPGAAVAGPLLAALVLLAGPVTFMPALREVGVAQQGPVLDVLGSLWPVVGMFSAIRGSLPFAWQQTALMYQMTALGQDMAMPDAAWWVGAVVLGTLGAAAGVGARLYPVAK